MQLFDSKYLSAICGAGVVQSRHMKNFVVLFTLAELQTMTTIADNELFRMKYINIRLPGFVQNPDLMRLAQSAVRVLGEALKEAKGFNKLTGGFSLARNL